MSTVLSHIVQKRFSRQYEDVATDALAYVLKKSDAAHAGMMKLLRGVAPDLPQVRFETQRTEGAIRPDMWGLDGPVGARAFVENKFWAGLTGNQPVSYLKQLAKYPQPTVLLIIAPAKRQQPLLRMLRQRLDTDGSGYSERQSTADVIWCVAMRDGPLLALTSWDRVLAALEEAVDDPDISGDLVQLRGLCEAADVDEFIPVSLAETTDQRIPSFILQLGAAMDDAVERAVSAGLMSFGRLQPQASLHPHRTIRATRRRSRSRGLDRHSLRSLEVARRNSVVGGIFRNERLRARV